MVRPVADERGVGAEHVAERALDLRRVVKVAIEPPHRSVDQAAERGNVVEGREPKSAARRIPQSVREHGADVTL